MSVLSIPDFFVDDANGEKQMIKDMKNLLMKVFPCSKPTSLDMLKGGLTNKLYVATVEEPESEGRVYRVNIRVNGEGSEKLVSRTKEIEIFQALSKTGSGAKLHAIFGNGLIYDFLEGRALTYLDIRTKKHQKGIAKMVARMHKLKNLKISDTSICVDKFMDSWLEELRKIDLSQHNPELQKRLHEGVDLEKLASEIQFLKDLVKEKKLDDNIVFCHNDLLGGNIIFNEAQDTYNIIDLEYSGMNYRCFDLGDHLSEYTGFETEDEEISDNYSPSKEVILNFLKHYLVEYYDVEIFEENMLERAYIECMIGKLLANLMWSIWSFNCHFHKNVFLLRNNDNSKIAKNRKEEEEEEFDYFTYGEQRLKVYYKEKEFVLKEII